MIERMRGSWRSRQRTPWARLAPFVALAALAAAVVLPNLTPPLSLANPDRTSVTDFRAAVAALPAEPLVLVAFDADFGTYPEISYVTRSVLADLLGRGASLAFVSYSPEGRALAVAELDRLHRDGTPEDRLLDLGYRSGVEAALVLSVTSVVPDAATGALAQRVRAAGGGIDAFNAALVVGGTDLGPRAWVEQVSTRVPELPILAVAPTFLRPELEPYVHSGQLTALLGTLRDGVAYGAASDTPSGRPPSALAMLIGMLIGLGVLLEASGGGAFGRLRAFGSRGRQ